jgi:hypothetical protein
MPRSGFAREARRRPDLDLLLGPLEAAAMNEDGSRSESVLEDVELMDPSELPTWREDG